MGIFFDIEEKKRESEVQDAAIDMMLDILASKSPRMAVEVKLVKLSKKFAHRLTEIATSTVMNKNFTDEQLESMTNYFAMSIAGLETFIEQFESTVEKENPHSSGN
ncbi:MAG: hypothetical protein IJ349_05460 [Clostridia bacterium]|nr:hypothetical protein [Clostridia bacterium]